MRRQTGYERFRPDLQVGDHADAHLVRSEGNRARAGYPLQRVVALAGLEARWLDGSGGPVTCVLAQSKAMSRSPVVAADQGFGVEGRWG